MFCKAGFDHLRSCGRPAQVCEGLLPMAVSCLVLVLVLSSTHGLAQNFHKDKYKYYKSIYKRSNTTYAKACDLLKKKQSSTKNKKVSSQASGKHRSEPKSMAEVGPPVTASTKPTPVINKPAPKVAPAKPTFTPAPIVSKETLDKLHNREDQVLKLNHLPTPTSEKHEEIRRLVANTLANKKDTEPIALEPLYFTFDQDEFSVVDMEPFLIAVEFALQGKHILIEGHTDHKGADDYNVQLSMKRVQKIRQLMLDMGVSDDQISIVGYGEEVADHTDKSDQGRQENRRVDFKAF